MADPVREFLSTPLEGGRPLAVEAPDGTPLHAEVFGPDDGPTVVLVHGWMEAAGIWIHQIRDLSADHRVVAWELRGHGHSAEPASRDYSIEALAGDLDAVLDASLRNGERAVVAGHSLGGMTVVAWAGQHGATTSDRLAAAALVNTGMYGLIADSLVVRTPGVLESIGEIVGRTIMSAPGALPPRTNPITHEAVRYLCFGPAASPATIEFCEEMLLACGPDARAGCGATMSRLDLRESIASLDVPTVVLAGERDRLTPPIHSRRLVEALPEPASYVELPRVGHMGPVEAPEAVSNQIRDLAREHLGDRAREVAA
jgi:pimeloyl-ACP methyl ester carboxylesterase